MNSAAFIQSFGIFSREGKIQPASRSEVRRWIESGSVWVNGERMELEEMDFPITSLVVFPKGKRVTLK